MLYSQYLFKKTAIGFLAITGILVSLIWFSRAITFVKYVTENGVELSQFFYLFILILPWLSAYIIPFALFGTVLFIYNKLINSNEITILKNSGLTKISISKPIIKLAIICSIICYIISLYLMPLANKELRVSRINFKNNYASLSFNPKTFEILKDLTIYANERNENNILYGILLHDKRSEDYSLTITAQKGKIIVEKSSVLLYMDSGTLQKTNYQTLKSEILKFDNYVFNLSENHGESTQRAWKAREQYLHELFASINEDEEQKGEYISEINQRFTQPLLPIIFSLIAVSSMLRGSFSRNGNIKNIIFAIINAVIFISINLTLYDLIESSSNYIPLLYINFIFFTILSIVIMSSNYRKIK